MVNAAEAEEPEEQYGKTDELQGAHDERMWSTQHVLYRYAGERRTDDEQRSRHGHVADESDWLRDAARCLPAGAYYYYRYVRGNHRRRAEQLPVQTLLESLARDEHHTEDEDGERVEDVEDAGIEHGVTAEDARYDRIADEAYVAVRQHEAVHAAKFALHAHQTRQDERQDDENGVRDSADEQQHGDVRAVRHAVAHGGGEHQCRARHLYDEE